MTDRGRTAHAGPFLLRLGALAGWAYVCIVFLHGQTIAGMSIGGTRLVLALLAGFVLILAATAQWIRRIVPPTRMLEGGVALLATLVTLIAADVASSMWLRRGQLRAEASIAPGIREQDPHVWHGELYPRSYVPNGNGFAIHKPDLRLTGATYGEYYNPAMLASPTLVDSVLELRRLSYFIGPEGLRDLDPLAEARIFALGDSFVFGYATTEGKVWTDLLGDALGEPVFNLGVSSTGPRAHLELLRYMFETYNDVAHVEHVLWMIFEGNDLENSYDVGGPIPPARHPRTELLEGTVVEAILSLPGRLRNQSLLRRVRDGELRLAAPTTPGMHEIEGVALGVPLFHSKRWGYRFFNPDDMERATRPRAYVLEHPNRPKLDRTFEEMRELSEQHGFRVTVITAPSDARLYGPAFEGFPELAERPHFLDYVVDLSGRMGFDTVDLLPLLEPWADREMLYYRDDHHWNERGNEVVARLLARALGGRGGGETAENGRFNRGGR